MKGVILYHYLIKHLFLGPHTSYRFGVESFHPLLERMLPISHEVYKPFLDINDMKEEIQDSGHCKKYFQEAVLHRNVERNVFGGQVTGPVCLVTQLNTERLKMLQSVLTYWKGEIPKNNYT